ncbi:HNH endonuclease [Ramlibacter sp. XY19]|uniref:HNH endonuclease n=1 Tax=Ramlibacter paludis TaxID=2908000 RepID=UPI0023DBE7B3|nr:HNH endonuclease [Ramlibacter paludis]MCG2592213.1 HNH endonuclease [Ramlibacter paludis]
MAFVEKGQRLRAFHTEGMKKAPVELHAGQTFVFMTASHDRVQQLVGVAGNAMHIGAERYQSERERLARMLNVRDFWRDAWALEALRKRYRDSAQFRQVWNTDVSWVPNWVCPDDYFMWLAEPVTLDAPKITGGTTLPKMFTAYMSVERKVAAAIMNTIPHRQRTPTWVRLMDAMRSTPEEPVPQLDGDSGESATTRLVEIQARVGQGRFREDLLRFWGDKCAVTNLSCPELLRASHVKPWATSTPKQRRDPHNGLLLAAHLDAMFDKGLISFDDGGKMLISPRLAREERDYFGLPRSLRAAPGTALKAYLAHHRSQVFDRGA